ncbi:MAG: galactose mutarotase [Lachnospiraceae bacterium]|nr:galactose mutarotase [Lachnospiraceae bacterium]
MIQKRTFGVLKDGTEIFLYHIENSRGEYIEVLSYGAVLHRVVVRDQNGDLGDVVLGAADAEQLTGFCLAGAVVGRCANRIADARYVLDGKEYHLEAGRGGHCLHSGSGNYANRSFSGICVGEENKVVLSLWDDGAVGFACGADVQVGYQFDDDARVTITYHIVPDGTTVISPTNHSYFNLGCRDSRDQILWVDSDSYAVKAADDVPRGEVASVAGTWLDFRTPVLLRNAMENDPTGHGYDDHLILNGNGFRHVATLSCPETGREMKVHTDMPSLVLFTFGAPREIPGKDGEVYCGYRSVCLETGYVANAVNCQEFVSPVFHKGEKMHSVTTYTFTVKV